MRVICVLLIVIALCRAAPGPSDEKIEIFSGVTINKNALGEKNLNIKLEAEDLKGAVKTFEEARAKITKYSPLLAGIGVKVVAVVGLLFGALTLLVTKALVIAKLAFLAAAALGLHKYFSGEGFNSISKASGFPASTQQWASPSASGSSYPYARSVSQDSNDLAYKGQVPS
ncbi:hypothetical protein KGM_200241 [Danaus plexippus plexippus]|uniref:Uncharacterized protein n=1 Tax=Danaus plexippus plexippus TaxID=278856 RepID=A0A212FFI5_DANPL|nr:hypothetical protein KGM_200241 [Danaus plexippus plexippus]